MEFLKKGREKKERKLLEINLQNRSHGVFFLTLPILFLSMEYKIPVWMNPRAFQRGSDYMEFESKIFSFLNPFKTKQGGKR